METRARRVPMLLPPNDYEALKALAEREERTPTQQAAYLVRRSLVGALTTHVEDAGVQLAGAGAASRQE